MKQPEKSRVQDLWDRGVSSGISANEIFRCTYEIMHCSFASNITQNMKSFSEFRSDFACHYFARSFHQFLLTERFKTDTLIVINNRNGRSLIDSEIQQ